MKKQIIFWKKILNEYKNSLKIKEDAAIAYKENDPQKAIGLFKECYDVDNRRQKSLRGLGLYLSRSKVSKEKLENLNSSIKYYIELVGIDNNTKIFDLTGLGGSLLYKY